VNGKLMSSVISHCDLEIEYKVGKWTKALVGLLLCFRKLDDARRFVKGRPSMIYRCQARGIKKISRLLYTDEVIQLGFHGAKRWWSGSDWYNPKRINTGMKPPKGTWGAKKIKLVEEVK